MRLIRRTAIALLLVTATICALVAGQRARLNAAVEDGSIRQLDATRGEVLLAQARFALADGNLPLALDRLKRAEADPRWRVAALYNAGNAHQRAALALRDGGAPAAQLAAAELAKRSYRAALRLAPEHAGARFNLERALRLAPDPSDEPPAGPPHGSERAATTMRGTTLGLP
jgi:mxaK protein